MTLTVFLSSRISPRTSTVTFFERSPLATRGRHLGDVSHLAGEVAGHGVDVVGEVLPDSADALDLGLAAKLASVPTSRATRVTSLANALSWSTMTLTVFLSSRISPRTSTVTFFERSPLATRSSLGDVSNLAG